MGDALSVPFIVSWEPVISNSTRLLSPLFSSHLAGFKCNVPRSLSYKLHLSDLEHEKKVSFNMTKNCEKLQVTRKIVRLAIFRNFC